MMEGPDASLPNLEPCVAMKLADFGQSQQRQRCSGIRKDYWSRSAVWRGARLSGVIQVQLWILADLASFGMIPWTMSSINVRLLRVWTRSPVQISIGPGCPVVL